MSTQKHDPKKYLEAVNNYFLKFEKACTNCQHYSPDDEVECTQLEQAKLDKLFDAWEEQYETLSCSGKSLDKFMAAHCKAWALKR